MRLIVFIFLIKLLIAYDYLRFVQIWGPEGCREYNSHNYCPNEFTIHGLWPEYTNGYPSFCGGDFNSTDISSIINTLMRDWPTYIDTNISNDIKFWRHEYLKHGTCMHLEESGYFRTALEFHRLFNLTEIIPVGYYTNSQLKSILFNRYDIPNVLICNKNRTRLAQVDLCIGTDRCERHGFSRYNALCGDSIIVV